VPLSPCSFAHRTCARSASALRVRFLQPLGATAATRGEPHCDVKAPSCGEREEGDRDVTNIGSVQETRQGRGPDARSRVQLQEKSGEG
jgi:hypothetical protein